MGKTTEKDIVRLGSTTNVTPKPKTFVRFVKAFLNLSKKTFTHPSLFLY